MNGEHHRTDDSGPLGTAVQGEMSWDEKLYLWLLFVLTLLSGWAGSHSDSTLVSSAVFPLVVRMRYFLCLVIVLFCWRRLVITWQLLVPLSYFLITSCDNYGGIAIQNMLMTIMVSMYLMAAESVRRRLFDMLYVALVVMSAVGIVCYVSNALGLPLPYRVAPYYFNEDRLLYYDYRIAYLYQDLNQTRLCGLFNEPGYFGTVIALMLCARGIRWHSLDIWVLVVAGVLTYSLAFLVILVLYLVLEHVNGNMSLTQSLLVAVPVVLAAFVILRLVELPGLDRFLRRVLSFMSEFNLDEQRSSFIIDSEFSRVLGGTHFIWGNGGGYSKMLASIWTVDGIATYKTSIIDYGAIGGTIVLAAPVIVGLISTLRMGDPRLRRRGVTLCICLLASIAQRPTIYDLIYLAILFGGLALPETDADANEGSGVASVPEKLHGEAADIA